MMEWVSVKERLPDDGEMVLVVRPDSATTVRKIHFIQWHFSDSDDFIYWMKCPDFPPGEKE